MEHGDFEHRALIYEGAEEYLAGTVHVSAGEQEYGATPGDSFARA